MRTLAMLSLLSLALTAHADLGPDPSEIYGRLVAPCCWNQTLDIHDSELATQLRVEIAQRLHAGEPSSAIEDELAARFGERIRAVPRAQDPRQTMGIAVLGAWVIALFALLALARRGMQRRVELSSPYAEDEYDAQLDRELRRADWER